MLSNDLPARPYQEGDDVFEYFLQFHAPKTLSSIQCFTDALIALAGTGSEVMMTVIDTESPYDYEARFFSKLRFPVGEPKSIVEAPAHLFQPDELSDLVPMFSLTVGWHWEAYLHMQRTRTVLLNWEGEIFDLWTNDQGVFSGVAGMLQTFGLSEKAQFDAPDADTAENSANPDMGGAPPSIT